MGNSMTLFCPVVPQKEQQQQQNLNKQWERQLLEEEEEVLLDYFALKCSRKVGIVRLDGALYSAAHYDKAAVVGDDADVHTFLRSQPGFLAMYLRAEGYTFDVCQHGLIESENNGNSQEKPTFAKEGRIAIEGSPEDANHLFIPSRVPKSDPRKRQPSRTEPWVDEHTGEQKGVIYVYESDLMLSNLQKCIRDLVEANCQAISSACGFMANVQSLCVQAAGRVPCLMSSLALLPLLYRSVQGKILILTANSESLQADRHYQGLIAATMPHDKPDSVVIVGLQQAYGFGKEVAAGRTVNCSEAEEEIVWKVKDALVQHPDVKAILSECTELPGYTNRLRQELGLPVVDALSVCSFLMHAVLPTQGLGNHAHLVAAHDHHHK